MYYNLYIFVPNKYSIQFKLFRNQWEVHQNRPSHKHTEFQNDWSISSRETGGVNSTPWTDLLLKIPGQVIGLSKILACIKFWGNILVYSILLIIR